MSLKIDLKPGEKFIVNGAVLKAGRRRVSLMLENEAVLLRSKDIMQQEEANTPARRIYFTIMLLYIHGDAPKLKAQFDAFLDDFIQVTTLREIRSALFEIQRDVEHGRLYHAMKTCKWLIDVENQLLTIPPKKSAADGGPAHAQEPS